MDMDANIILDRLDGYLNEFLRVRDAGKQNLPAGHADLLDRDNARKDLESAIREALDKAGRAPGVTLFRAQ
jgi:hypothetical protein